jgi:hypothetical protein
VAIQNGGLEWFEGTDAGGILWPADQWTIITLVVKDGLLQDFYYEASALLLGLLDDTGLVHHHQVVSDALELNRMLFSTPEKAEGAQVFVWHNVWDRYLAVMSQRGPATHAALHPLHGRQLAVHRDDARRLVRPARVV